MGYYPDEDPERLLRQFNDDILVAMTVECSPDSSDFYLDYGEELFTSVIIENAVVATLDELHLPEQLYSKVNELKLLGVNGPIHISFHVP